AATTVAGAAADLGLGAGAAADLGLGAAPVVAEVAPAAVEAVGTAAPEAGAAVATGSSAATVAGLAAPAAILAFIGWNAVSLLFGGPDYGTEIGPSWITNDSYPVDPNLYVAAHTYGDIPQRPAGWVYVPKSLLQTGTRDTSVKGIVTLR